MSIKKRVAIGLIMTLMGLCIDKIQLAFQHKQGIYECTQVMGEYNGDDTYRACNILEGDISITTSGSYYLSGKGITTSHNIVVNNGVKDVKIILDNVNIDASKGQGRSAIDIYGEAELILLGENSMVGGNMKTGIAIRNTGVLTIHKDSTGSLKIKGGNLAPAIGAPMYKNGGKLYINGGTIQAYGRGYSAAIGVSEYDKTSRMMKGIVINGGNIYCEAGDNAAAIGGGKYNNVRNIEINDGYIVAKGGRRASAIGGGYQCKLEDCKLAINGGTVITYQGDRISHNYEYAQPIQLNEDTTIQNEAVVLAVGHINEDSNSNLFETVNVEGLGEKITVLSKELDLQEQINLEGKEKILNFHVPKGSYHIKIQGDEKDIEEDIGIPEEEVVEDLKEDNGDSKEELKEEDTEAPKEEVEEPRESIEDSKEESKENIEEPKEDIEKPEENIEEPKEEIKKPEENIEEPKEEIEKNEDNIEESKEDAEKTEENIEEPKEDIEKPEENIEEPKEDAEKPVENIEKPKEEIEEPKDNIDDSKEEVEELEESVDDFKQEILEEPKKEEQVVVENNIPSKDMIENHESINNRIKINSEPTFYRPQWQDIRFCRTTLGCYISYGIKFDEKALGVGPKVKYKNLPMNFMFISRSDMYIDTMYMLFCQSLI